MLSCVLDKQNAFKDVSGGSYIKTEGKLKLANRIFLNFTGI